MPRIGLITPVYHVPSNPYHADYDNLPLRNIVERQNLINNAVDNLTELMQEGKGTQGSIANRIAQSIDENGDLIPGSMDSSMHSVGAHTDGIWDGTNYVRMQEVERVKLDAISDGATALSIKFDTISTTVTFSDETVYFQNSDCVSWNVVAPNTIQALTAFPSTAAHQHFYDIIPTAENIALPDYINYVAPVAFIDGSLRVFVNGIRVPDTSVGAVYVYNAATGPSGSWALTSFTAVPLSGTFALSRALSSSDTILIDFDQSFV